MDYTHLFDKYTAKLTFLDHLRDWVDSHLLDKSVIGPSIKFIRANLFSCWVVPILFNIKPVLLFMTLFTVLLTRPLKDAHPLPAKAFWTFWKNAFIMSAVLVTENYLVFVISFFDDNKYDYYSLFLFPWWGYFIMHAKKVITIPEADRAFIILMLCLLLQFTRRWRSKKVNGYVWGTLYCRTTTILRVVRTVSFLSVVIPSPRKHCYADRYIKPPTNVPDFIMEMFKFRFGGCNDLLFSGHTLFFWVSIQVLNECEGGFTAKFLKIAVPPALVNMFMERWHYSLDIMLAVFAAHIVWKLLYHNSKAFIQENIRMEKELQHDLEESFVRAKRENKEKLSNNIKDKRIYQTVLGKLNP